MAEQCEPAIALPAGERRDPPERRDQRPGGAVRVGDAAGEGFGIAPLCASSVARGCISCCEPANPWAITTTGCTPPPAGRYTVAGVPAISTGVARMPAPAAWSIQSAVAIAARAAAASNALIERRIEG